MRGEDRLELGGRDLEGVDLDELLEPVDDEDLALLVDDDEVAGAQPPVGVDHRRGGVRTVQVPRHRLRPAHPQLAGLAGTEIGAAVGVDHAQLGARHRAPDGAGRDGQLTVRRGRRRRRLGQAVAEADDDAGQALADRPRDLAGNGRTARDDELEGGQVVGVDRRMAGQPRHDRGRPDEDRGAMAFDELDEGVEGEAGQRHGGRTRRQRVGQGDDEAHDVREGSDCDDGVARAQLQRGARLSHGGHEVGVGEHDALGQAGRAARVRQERHGTRGVERDRRRRPVGFDRAEGHDLAHTGRRGDLPRRGQARGNGGEDRGPAVHRLSGELALGGHRAGPADRGPGRHGAQGRDGPLGRVGRPEDKDVARTQPARREAGGRALDARGERPVGDGGAGRAVDQRDAIAHRLGRRQDRLMERGGARVDRIGRAPPHHSLPLLD